MHLAPDTRVTGSAEGVPGRYGAVSTTVGPRIRAFILGALIAIPLLLASPTDAAALPGYSDHGLPLSSSTAQTITAGEVRTSEHFVVHAASAHTADQAVDYAERAWDALAPHFEVLPYAPVTVVVVEDQDEYERIQPAEMTRGFATFGGNSIYLSGEDLDQEVVTHEVAHILLGKNVLPALAIPDWFNEGLAQFVSHAGGRDDEVFYLVASGRLLSLPELSRVDALRGPDRELATVFGLAIVRFLVGEYGEDALWDLVARLSHSPSFEQALFETYGQSDLELSDRWLAYAEDEYGIFSIVGLQTAGMAVLGLLALVAVVVWSASRVRLRGRPGSPLDLTPAEVEEADRAAAVLPPQSGAAPPSPVVAHRGGETRPQLPAGADPSPDDPDDQYIR
jgi:hypothetical protein